MSKKILNLPLSYEQTDFEDDRFTKVRVRVMHNGLNLNKSRFSDSVIEAAAPSLKNIPLLAFTKKVDGTDESDFAGHEFEFKMTENGIKYVYLGRPIGMVPETNNYAFDEDEEGVKFVSVDAYIWNEYANEALDIVKRDGQKGVSMEVGVNDYNIVDDGTFDILEYAYAGIVLLGDDVPPAMRNARLEIAEFSASTVSEFVSKFSQDLQKTINEANERKTDDKTDSEPQAEDSGEGEAGADSEPTKTDLPTPEAGGSTEKEEAPVVGEVVVSEERAVEEEGKVSGEPEGTREEEPQTEIEEPVVEETVVEEPVVEEVETEEVEVEVEKTEVEEPVVEETEVTEEPAYNPSTVVVSKEGISIRTMSSEVEDLIAENEALKEEIASLRAFKEKVEKEEFELKVNTLVESFSDLPEEDVREIVETETDYEKVELKLYALRGRLNTKTPANRIQAYAIYDSILPQDKPSWENLVEKYINKETK